MGRIAGTATQGGADAYAEGTITTALTGVSNRAYQVNRILVEITNAFGTCAGDSEIEVAVSRRTKTAMPTITDNDVLHKIGWVFPLTTSGQFAFAFVQEYVPRGTILIVEDPVYIEIDSDSTGLTNVAAVAIEYDIVSISEVDRLTLLTQSLD